MGRGGSNVRLDATVRGFARAFTIKEKRDGWWVVWRRLRASATTIWEPGLCLTASSMSLMLQMSHSSLSAPWIRGSLALPDSTEQTVAALSQNVRTVVPFEEWGPETDGYEQVQTLEGRDVETAADDAWGGKRGGSGRNSSRFRLHPLGKHQPRARAVPSRVLSGWPRWKGGGKTSSIWRLLGRRRWPWRSGDELWCGAGRGVWRWNDELLGCTLCSGRSCRGIAA